MEDLKSYRERFGESGWRVLVRTVRESRRRQQNYVSLERLLHALAAADAWTAHRRVVEQEAARGAGRRPDEFDYAEGDTVRIRSGPFAAFTGRVAGVLREAAVIKVLVNIFGRATPVDIPFSYAEKIDFRGGGRGRLRKQTL